MIRYGIIHYLPPSWQEVPYSETWAAASRTLCMKIHLNTSLLISGVDFKKSVLISGAAFRNSIS